MRSVARADSHLPDADKAQAAGLFRARSCIHTVSVPGGPTGTPRQFLRERAGGNVFPEMTQPEMFFLQYGISGGKTDWNEELQHEKGGENISGCARGARWNREDAKFEVQ